VFKVAVFRFDASVKTSSPLLDCRVNHSLVEFVAYTDTMDAVVTTYKVKVAQ